MWGPRAGTVGSLRMRQKECWTRSCSSFLLLPPRSHPTILDIPNRLYYEGELQACADVLDRERFCHWEGLPRQVKGSHPGTPMFLLLKGRGRMHLSGSHGPGPLSP